MKAIFKKASKEEIKEVCTSFFYWWYNQPGSNTEEGFNDWYSKQIKYPSNPTNEQ